MGGDGDSGSGSSSSSDSDSESDSSAPTKTTTKKTTTTSSTASSALFAMEGWLILPAVTGSMVSGMAQSFLYYGTIRNAPFHVQTSMQLFLCFGLWWAYTDKQSQKQLEKVASLQQQQQQQQEEEEEKNTATTTTTTIADDGGGGGSIWKRRRVYNVVSCLFVVALYGVMVLKPSGGCP